MKEDISKPLYADYKKQKAYRFFWSPVLSRERSYKLADRPLAILGEILIFAAIFIMGVYAPGVFSSIYSSILISLFIYLFFPASVLYGRLFVYRFGRFRVTWEDEELHPDEEASSHCGRNGRFIKTEENRRAAKKSRRSFLIFYAAVIAEVFLFCFLGYGLAYARMFNWHRGEIEEAAQIAQKYNSLTVVTWPLDIDAAGEAPDGSSISKQDTARLKQILGSLQWDYAAGMGLDEKPYETKPEHNRFVIYLRMGFSYSYLVRYEDILNISQAEKDHPDRQVTQLDEHWWYIR